VRDRAKTGSQKKCRMREKVTSFASTVKLKRFGLHVELDKHHIAVLNDIILAFVARFPRFARTCFAPQPHEVFVGYGLRANEAAFKVRMDNAGRLRRLGALLYGPGARFLGARGEEGDEVQKLVAGPYEPIQPGLVQTHGL